VGWRRSDFSVGTINGHTNILYIRKRGNIFLLFFISSSPGSFQGEMDACAPGGYASMSILIIIVSLGVYFTLTDVNMPGPLGIMFKYVFLLENKLLTLSPPTPEKGKTEGADKEGGEISFIYQRLFFHLS